MPVSILTRFKEKKKFDRFILLSGTGLIILLISLYILTQSTQFRKNSTQVTIGETIITAEIADTDEERSKGLSGRNSLPKNYGLLFVFEEAKKYPFWMKDMKFPIDIIWINKNEVVDITNHAPPETNTKSSLTIYKPKVPALYVLEVNANYVRENTIKVGDEVEISGLK